MFTSLWFKCVCGLSEVLKIAVNALTAMKIFIEECLFIYTSEQDNVPVPFKLGYTKCGYGY